MSAKQLEPDHSVRSVASRLGFTLFGQVNNVQYDLDGSNMTGSFTMAVSNSFLSSYEILPIAQGIKYSRN